MNNENALRAEQISALVDGELTIGEFASAVESVTSTREGMHSWQTYHLVGDAMRGTANPAALDGDDFVVRFRSRMAAQGVQYPLPLGDASTIAKDPVRVAREGANDPVIRWKLLAGFASLAAVAVFGWHIASLDVGRATLAEVTTEPLRQVVVAAGAASREQPAKPVAAVPVMLRDARLDELLAAHKQFGGTSALQMPAGFLRNATFDSSDR